MTRILALLFLLFLFPTSGAAAGEGCPEGASSAIFRLADVPDRSPVLSPERAARVAEILGQYGIAAAIPGNVPMDIALIDRQGCLVAIAAGRSRHGGVVALLDARRGEPIHVDTDAGFTFREIGWIAPGVVRVVYESGWGTGYQAFRQKLYGLKKSGSVAVLSLPESDYVAAGEVVKYTGVAMFESSLRSGDSELGPEFHIAQKAAFDGEHPDMELGATKYRWKASCETFEHVSGPRLHEAGLLQSLHLGQVMDRLRPVARRH